MKSAVLIQTTDAAADRESPEYDLGDLTTYSISVNFTGGAGDIAGTLTLEARNRTTEEWVTVANSSQAVTSSADHTWSVSGAGYRFVRVKWDYTSGTGNITADLNAKEIVVKGV